mmetsp:Transcript_31655/g.48416  ORF Transcript_31655/g.48416 Transcript_31655/m.48416 type:complete len:101 (-) Transcript_31655:110-412(-)
MALSDAEKIAPILLFIIFMVFFGVFLGLLLQVALIFTLLWLGDGQEKFQKWYIEEWPIIWDWIVGQAIYVYQLVMWIIRINVEDDLNLADKRDSMPNYNY